MLKPDSRALLAQTTHLRKPKPCHVFPQALIEVAERADNSTAQLVGKDGGAATNRRQVLDIWRDDGCGVNEA